MSRCPQCGDMLAGTMEVSCRVCELPLLLVANKYRLQEPLGEGGFARVYLAHHIGLDDHRERVIKVLKPHVMRDAAMVERFRREIQLTSRLARECEHIVYTYDDFGHSPFLGFYYVMEHLEGVTLEQALHQKAFSGLSLAWIIHVMVQLCDAMEVAHRAGILHRDLKPENIFLTNYRGKDDFVKLLDFGIARVLGDEQQELEDRILGTPLYTAPEQFLGNAVEPQTDIYSLGVILYRMLAGVTPFLPADGTREGMMELVLSHVNERPPSLSKRCPEGLVSSSLEDVVMCALAKEPDGRFVDVVAFKQALLEACPGVVGDLLVRSYESGSFASFSPLSRESVVASHANECLSGRGLFRHLPEQPDDAGALLRRTPPALLFNMGTPTPSSTLGVRQLTESAALVRSDGPEERLQEQALPQAPMLRTRRIMPDALLVWVLLGLLASLGLILTVVLW